MRMEWRRRALAVVTILVASGCAGTKTEKPAVSARPDTEVRVTRIERLNWNAPPEPNLFLVEFGAALSRNMRSRARAIENDGTTDPIRAELKVMEEEADREFLARGLCAHGAVIVPTVDGAPAGPTLVGHFRCRPRGVF